MTHLKLGYFPMNVPENCRPLVNQSSYWQTQSVCNADTKSIAMFAYVEYLHPSDAEMFPYFDTGKFSDTDHMTSNASAHQALQFGTVDGFVFTYFFITAELFEYFAFSNPYLEDQFCLVISSRAVYRYAETMDDLFWLRPFSAPVWSLLVTFLL